MNDSPDPRDDAAQQEASTRRRIVWGYVGGGALIVVAALLAWWALANGGSASAPTPAASATVSASASVSPTPTPADTVDAASASPAPSSDAVSQPPAAGEAPVLPVIETFEPASLTAECENDRSATAALSFSWRTSGADEVWIGAGTSDAAAQPFAAVDAASSAYGDLEFECVNEEQLYTLTARGPGGTVSSSVTVVRSIP